ncbi:ATP-binding protein [Lysobacter sp. F6437]|uniref:ATP-binding protein n=1 Tax=Lysobacter sp. F6437 TaxID=3459296 RepID=UPI00403DF52A
MRKLTRTAVAAAWLWMACITAAPTLVASPAIPEVPTLRHIGVADGLPSSDVKGLAFDPDGYLWIATIDGLARYDGVGMQVWRHVPGDASSLPGNYMTVLHVDPRGRVWVAPESRGLSVLDTARDGFRHYRKADHAQMGSDDVWAITSHDDALWFGTFGGGLHQLREDAGGETITRYMPREGDPRSLPSDIVLSLGVDRQDRLWVGTTAGLARWTGRDFERVALPGEVAAPAIFSVTPLGDDLWVGASSGVFRRGPDGTWQRPEWAAMFEAPSNTVFGMLAEPDGGMWLASARQLWRVSPGAIPVPVPIGAKGPVMPMFQILRQSNGAMWFPVPGVGLGYLQPDWRRIAQFDREHHGLSSEFYRDIAIAADGGTWLFGARGELERLDAEGVVHGLDEAVQDQLAGSAGLSVLEDSAGILWIGQRKRLSRLDPDSGVVQRWGVGDPADATLDGAPHLLVQAPDGDIWVSFSGRGLQRRDPSSGTVLQTILPGPRQGLGIGDIEAMAFDSRGALWIADGRGMRRWDVDADRFVTADGIEVGDRVFAFAFDDEGGLWLQHLAGLEHYLRVGDRWQRDARAGVAEGIPSLEGAGLEIDRNGRVWLSSRRGLFRWDPTSRHLRRFGLADGLGSQEFVDRALVMNSEGVLAATLADGGVVMIDTLAPDPPSLQPTLHFDRVEVRRDGRWIALDAVDAGTGLQLAPDDREMRVRLRLLSYDDPQANRYFTRLDGYDNDWIEQDQSGERIFASLPPGDYTLHARAVDAAGNASAEQVLSFTMQPPWWRTPPALAGFAALFALLLWWAFDEYRERLTRRQALQRARHENEVAREASLAKTRFLATLGHEVRTPMTGVLGMTELLLGTPLDPRQRGYADSIRGAGEHLLRLVNDALDLARIESGKLELAEQPFDLRALVDDVAALMAPLAAARGLAFAVEFDGDVANGWRGDPVRLRQILLNLVGNAIKFTEHGSVTLGASRDADTGIHLRVADTGPGLNEEQQARLFRRFEQAEGARTAARYGGSGLGLAICQELAAAMGGSITVESSPGVGATFDVHLPLPQAAVPTVATPPVAAGSARPLSVLLVEDDPIVAEVITGLVQAQRHRVNHVGHGLAALVEVATQRFDVALLDLDLPGMDGIALARHLRAQGIRSRLVAITARADAEAEPQAMAAGFDGFLRKPVTGALLRQQLEGELQAVE